MEDIFVKLIRYHQSNDYHPRDKLEEESPDDGTEQLRHPVEDAGENSDVAAERQPKRHRWVHVPAGDVRAYRHRHEQREPVSHRHRHQPRRIQRRVGRQLT